MRRIFHLFDYWLTVLPEAHGLLLATFQKVREKRQIAVPYEHKHLPSLSARHWNLPTQLTQSDHEHSLNQQKSLSFAQPGSLIQLV